MHITRRHLLGSAGALATLALWPVHGLAAESRSRMLVVLLRGGLDGLHALVPRADPAHARLRGSITPEATLPLDADFALHPALGFAHGLFRQGQPLPVVAIAPPYRERSHFEAQDCLENGSWDTHSNQASVLARKLAELDAGLRAFHQHSGAAWKHSVVVVVSEFGRTAAVNGTGGTDHGTGGLALLAGGAVSGGKVAGDWPGLAPAALNQGRDLRTTTDMRALFKAVLAGHLGVREALLETDVFPGSRAVKAMPGLLA